MKIRSLLALAVAWLSLFLSGMAFAFETAPYFPLGIGDSWTYRVDGGPSTLTYAVSGTTSFNGRTVKILSSQPDGGDEYYTNDANGIRLHGGAFDLEGISATITMNPPVMLAAANATIGVTASTRGEVVTTVVGAGSLRLGYATTSTPLRFETVTVPAGSFTALRLEETDNISGWLNGVWFQEVARSTYWLVSGIGVVKQVTGDGASTSTYGLVSSSRIDTTPDKPVFTPQSDVAPGSTVTSNAVTISGITTPVRISITGGTYNINGGAYSATAATVRTGDKVTIQLVASARPIGSRTATLTIGDVSATFTAKTAIPAGTNGIFYISQPGDWIGQGLTALLAADAGCSMGVSLSKDGVISIDMGYRCPSGWSLDLAAPQHRTIQPGRYGPAERIPFQPARKAGLTMSGDGRGCNTLTGRFYVHQVAYGADGKVEALAADFEQHCDGRATALFGQVRYHSDVPFDTSGTSPFPMSFEPVRDAAPQTQVTSQTRRVEGISRPSPISVVGGKYRIGAGPFTNKPGLVRNGQNVTLRTTSRPASGGIKGTRLTIGSMQTVWRVKTVLSP